MTLRSTFHLVSFPVLQTVLKITTGEHIPGIFSSLKHSPHGKMLFRECLQRIEKNKAELHVSAREDLRNNSSSCSFLKEES
jgi:hypothetical protein